MSNFDANIMDWDSVIESDGQPFVVLDEGDYAFTVTSFERSHYAGSTKLPPCKKASLMLTVYLPDGQSATCREDFILYRSLEWKISAFFRAIGQKKCGEQVAMDWSKVVGTSGRAHFKPRTYVSNGVERTTNSVDHYYDAPQVVQQNQQNTQPNQNSWVQEAVQAARSGNVQQMAVQPQQMTWQNGGF